MFHCISAVGGLIGAIIGGLLMEHNISVFHETVFLSFILILPGFIFSCWLFSSGEERLINQSALLSYDHIYDKLDINEHNYDIHYNSNNPITYHPDFRNHKIDHNNTNNSNSSGGNNTNHKHFNNSGNNSNNSLHTSGGHSSNSIHNILTNNSNITNSGPSPIDR